MILRFGVNVFFTITTDNVHGCTHTRVFALRNNRWNCSGLYYHELIVLAACEALVAVKGCSWLPPHDLLPNTFA